MISTLPNAGLRHGMRHILLLAGLLTYSSTTNAQTPVDKLPAGSLISGWAVEAIPQQNLSRIDDYVGQLGTSRLSIDANQFSSGPFEQLTGVRQRMVFNGRAFFRVRSPQRYVFVATPFAGVRGGASCDIDLQVGKSSIIRKGFGNSSDGAARRPQMSGESTPGIPLSGQLDLQPGFYPIEFVAGCLGQAAYLEIRFSLRSERDATLRNFEKDELFHIQR